MEPIEQIALQTMTAPVRGNRFAKIPASGAGELYLAPRGEEGATITLRREPSVWRDLETGRPCYLEIAGTVVVKAAGSTVPIAILPDGCCALCVLAWSGDRWCIATMSDGVIDGAQLS